MLAQSASVIITLLLALPFIYVVRSVLIRTPLSSAEEIAAKSTVKEASDKPMMQPERTDLAPPKDDPFTLEQLKEFDGTDPSKPLYVSIKGTVFDVSRKRDTYGPGKSYSVFSGKDASKALGLSSLKPEDCIPDYSELAPKDMKTLNDWFDFFSKRYNIVGRVVDLPTAVANL